MHPTSSSKPAASVVTAFARSGRGVCALTLAAIALSPVACDCDPENVDNIRCDFTVEPNNAPIEFPQTAIDTERVRSFRINNTGNRTLNAFTFDFEGTNAQHYRTENPDIEDSLEINADDNAAVAVIFEPLVLSNNLASRLVIRHETIGEVGCPSRVIELNGSSFERPEIDGGPLEPDDGGGEPEPEVDGGDDDAGIPDGGPLEPEDGGELVDAGEVQFADAGVELGPNSHWETRGALAQPRAGFGALELSDGTILAVGGYGEDGRMLDTIEQFDPTTGNSSVVGTMALPRGEPGVARLPDGRVVIAGGLTSLASGFASTTIELFTPAATAGEEGNVVCPPPQQDCGLDDIDQGRGLMTIGRINPIVTVTDAATVVVGFGRTIDDGGEEVATAGADVLTLTTPATVAALSGSDAILPRTDEIRHIAPDGSFLLIGGRGLNSPALADITRFDANTGIIGPVSASLTVPRSFAAAAERLDGSLLIAGGLSAAGGALTSLERIEDPFGALTVTNLDFEVPPRISPIFVSLPGEFLLYASGAPAPYHELEAVESVVPRRDADIFVPLGTDDFLRLSPDNDLAVGRVGHAQFLVDGEEVDDTVLFLGGYNVLPRRIPHPHAERYVLADNRFDIFGLMGDGAGVTIAGFPPAGAVMTLGGTDPHTGALSGDMRIYDLENETYAALEGMAEPRRDFSITDLDDGYYLIAGGKDASGQVLDTATIFNPFTGVDAVLPVALNRARARHTATLLDDGTVLLCGGEGTGGEALDVCEVFERPDDLADQETWDTAAFELVLGRLSRGRVDHTANLLDTGEVLLMGGGDIEREQTAADLFLPGPRQVRATGMPNRPRRRHAAMHFGSGRVLVAGGETFFGELAASASAEVYERANEIFIPVDDMEFARVDPVALLTNNGSVLVVGGARPAQDGFPTRAVTATDLYEPGVTGIGEFAGTVDLPLNYGRAGHSLPNELFGIVVGGTHRDGRIGTGIERRSPLFFVEVLVND